MRILITGGAGFIGGHLAESFVEEGHDVTALDNFDPYYDTGIKEHNVEAASGAAEQSDGSYEIVRGDIRDEELVGDLVADTEFVYHIAAQAGVRASVDQPHKVNSINVDGTVNVLEAALDATVERVINASSSSVYGVPDYLPYDEDHPTTPISPYAVSKLAAEHYARVYSRIHDLPTVTLRYFTVYGPRMRPNMAISNFVSRCLNDEPPVIYGDGTQTRDFTYVDDVIDANRLLLETDAADGEVMNIGSTSNIEIGELAEIVRDRLAPDLELAYGERYAADADHTHADVSKARELIGYEPSVPIRKGIELFIEWYVENREWYEPLVRRS